MGRKRKSKRFNRIQIQLLLKLNFSKNKVIRVIDENSNTTLVKVKLNITANVMLDET